MTTSPPVETSTHGERTDHGARFILPLRASPPRAARVGSKAARLAELVEAGFAVPDGFVVTTEAFDGFVAAHALADGASTEDVLRAPIPEAVARAVREAMVDFGDGELAVRSSGVAEDLAEGSFAGQYESVLGVKGADAVLDALRVVWASAFAPHVEVYRSTLPEPPARTMAVLVQRMVDASAAGVAFSADAVSGDRNTATLSAVTGCGAALVSGHRAAEEWSAVGDALTRRRSVERVLEEHQARAVVELVRAVEAHHGGTPQDIEWALAGDTLCLLQARPMTALPEVVEWTPPVPGCWVRDFRLGEWLGGPTTPLFATWLLPGIEGAFHGVFERYFNGLTMPEPGHVLVHGFYFYGLDYMKLSPWTMLRMLPSLLFHFRRSVGFIPPLAHLGVDWHISDWRERVEPAYLDAIARAGARVETASPSELRSMIDELAVLAGEYFASMAAVAGYAAKAEYPLAKVWRRDVEPVTGHHVYEVVRGAAVHGAEPDGHAVQDLDWVHHTHGERAGTPSAPHVDVGLVQTRVAGEREAVLAKEREALPSRRARERLDRLVAEACRAHQLREEQSAGFTRAWPVLRRAVRRIGESLEASGAIGRRDDVFFLERAEVERALEGARLRATIARERREVWERQRRLTPPMCLGTPPKQLEQGLRAVLGVIATPRDAERPGLEGVPASPGRATGPVRIVHGLDELARLKEGEILVAPITTPAWTPAFGRAAAVVTDIGSVASHASVVAREFGIPAVVATQDATARLCDGQIVTVDGGAGFVEIEPEARG